MPVFKMKILLQFSLLTSSYSILWYCSMSHILLLILHYNYAAKRTLFGTHVLSVSLAAETGKNSIVLAEKMMYVRKLELSRELLNRKESDGSKYVVNREFFSGFIFTSA